MRFSRGFHLNFNLILAFALLTFCFANCNQTATDTPTATLQNYLQAASKKDAAAMKRQMSNGTLKIMEETARQQNTTLDQVLIQDATRSLSSKVAQPETRNEQITNDTATLEVKNPNTGGWDKLYFQRENGAWKIAHDKMMQEMLKETDELTPN